MPEPALIFDFGNVIGFFDHMRAYERFAPLLGIDSAQLRRLLIERGFIPLLLEFECGRIEPDRFVERAIELVGISLPHDQFIAAWNDIFWPNESMAELVRWLKSQGHTLVLGSNTNILHSAHYCRQFAPTLAHFDQLVFSHGVGAMKPAQAFYEACIAAAGVPAASCLFVDDIGENVEGARRAGLSAHQYRDTPGLIVELRRVGIQVPELEC
jgi:putative hydrolase of the HAD superfamily